MKTLKEIHESQGGKFGYRLSCKHHFSTFKVIGYDSEDDNFFLRNKMTGDIIQECSASTIFTLIEEPVEIWVNVYKGDKVATYFAFHKSRAEASEAADAHNFIRTAKFKEVIET